MQTRDHTSRYPNARYIRTVFPNLLLVFALAILTVLQPSPVSAQAEPNSYPLEKCQEGAFSTEEDFVMQEGEQYDGNPYISDGDVLSFSGVVCARNRDLLASFAVGRYLPDLGLDALEIIDIPSRLIAFSTELDDPALHFESGDLLFTNGAVIPNLALVKPFGIDYSIGLDGLQFVGEQERIIKFADSLVNVPRDTLLRDPEQLRKLLEELDIDIWFSTEGTFGAPREPKILDGDLLSVRTASLVATNSDLLPATVPAGLPKRGVDFGLDGVMAVRSADAERAKATLRFSTELLFDGEPTFTDGDILAIGGGVVTKNETLVAPFQPAAEFLGLDALSARISTRVENPDPLITHIGGQGVGDIHQGVVPTGTGTGAYPAGTYQAGLSDGTPSLPYRPFGSQIPIDGIIQSDTTEFRVMYANLADGIPHPIMTTWKINVWTGDIFDPCDDSTVTWGNGGSPDGWFDAAQYRAYRFTPGFCPNTHLVLAVWNSKIVADPNAQHIVWLEYRTAGGGTTIYREPMDHHVQLDNTAPEIVKMELRTLDGTVVPACGGAGAGVTQFNVYAEIHDEWFDQYRIYVKGGNPPATAPYIKAWYPVDPTDHLDQQGTTPAGLQLIQTIDMTDLGASFVDCCYLLEMFAHETTIHHSFNGHIAQVVNSPYDYSFLTFAAAP